VWIACVLSCHSSTNGLDRAISHTGQFVVFAPRQPLPTLLCVFAERVKREWLQQLDLRDEWRDPIVLATSDEDRAISMRVLRSDPHLKYEIRWGTLAPHNENEQVVIMVEALCAELANRRQPSDRLVAIPAWLIQGLAQGIHGQTESLLAINRRSLMGGRPATARSLLCTVQTPSDPAERKLFQAQAWLLIDALQSLPGGGRKLARLVAELRSYPSVLDAFEAIYGNDFPDTRSLEKWWGLALARNLQMSVPGNLTLAETERQLETLLRARLARSLQGAELPQEQEVSLEEMSRQHEQKWMKILLQEKLQRLALLRAVAHPLYRQTLQQYEEALRWLWEENLNRFRYFWKQAGKSRQAVTSIARRITTWLDQEERIYDGTATPNPFAGAFRVFEEMEQLKQQRHDPIRDYLDQFDP